jgi:hypothetical protein
MKEMKKSEKKSKQTIVNSQTNRIVNNIKPIEI